MDKLYDYNGVQLEIGGTGIGVSYIVKGINHRGYNYSTSASGAVVVNNMDGAPENTLPAYILSAQKGFKYVECDISFTSDNVAVLLHDSTINRTSNGTGAIGSMTLAQAQAYKFNYILGTVISGYSDVTIPTFEDFIKLCRNLSLHPYIELKEGTEAQIKGVVDLVEAAGMKGKVTYISFNATYLGYVKDYDAFARLGYVRNNETGADAIDATAITTAQGLMTGTNEVFMDTKTYTTTAVQLCLNAHIPMETWGICYADTKADIIGLNQYITGVTSNKLDAGKVLYDSAIGN